MGTNFSALLSDLCLSYTNLDLKIKRAFVLLGKLFILLSLGRGNFRAWGKYNKDVGELMLFPLLMLFLLNH